MQGEAAPGTPSWLASVNDRAALRLALEHGVITRNLVHQQTGLSKPTASQMIARLTAANLIRDIGPVPGNRGPNPIGYAPNPDVLLGVAMEVSESAIDAVLVDVLGTSHPRVHLDRLRDIEPDLAAETAVSEVRTAVAMAAAAGGRESSDIDQLLISVPASVSPIEDQLHFAGSVEPWPTVGLTALLSDQLGVAVTFDRDAYLATTAEMGLRPDEATFSLMWLGWGLGMVTVFDRKVVRGADGKAGEIGYLVPHREASMKDMQDLLGGKSFVNQMRRAGYDGHSYTGAVEHLESLCDGAAEHSPQALAVLRTLVSRIVDLVAPAVFLTDPGLLVLGGPVGAAGAQTLADMVSAEVKAQTGWELRVEPTALVAGQALNGAVEQLRAQLIAELLRDPQE